MFFEMFCENDKYNLFCLGPYPVGKTAKTFLPFSRALTAVSRSGFKTISQPASAATAPPRQITSIHVGLTAYCLKLTKQNFVAAGGRRNEKLGVFVAGVPSSLVPSPPFFSRVLATFPLPRFYAG